MTNCQYGRRVMNLSEDIEVLVSEMKKHLGSNEIEIARNSKGFNDFSALPIDRAETGTQRFLDGWSTTQQWVDDMLAGPNQGHLFMDQPEFDEDEVEGFPREDDEGDLDSDLQAAAAMSALEDTAWVKNAVNQWEKSHQDKEGLMDDREANQARVLLTRHASRVKVLCAKRYAAAEQEASEAQAQLASLAAAKERQDATAAEYERIHWSVKQIRGKRHHPIHGLQYKVQWTGHPREDDSWENAEFVKQSARLIAEFEQRSERWHRTHGTYKEAARLARNQEESSSDSEDDQPLGILLNRDSQ
jgi:hypothetical protein